MREYIPKQVTRFAKERGFNSISWAGKNNDGDFYSVGVADKDNTDLPIGLPHFLVFKDGDCSIICDEDLRITSMFDE